MIVIQLINPPPQLSGMLTKYLIKAPPYIYFGVISKRTRDSIIEEVKNGIGAKGQAIVIQTTNTIAGYDIQIFGHSQSEVLEIDGLQFIVHKDRENISSDIGNNWKSNQSKYLKSRRFRNK